MNKQSIGEMLRKIDARPDELEAYQGLWANLSLFTCGSGMGWRRFNTEQEAKLLSDDVDAEGWTLLRTDKGLFEFKDYIFTIQIPVKS